MQNNGSVFASLRTFSSRRPVWAGARGAGVGNALAGARALTGAGNALADTERVLTGAGKAAPWSREGIGVMRAAPLAAPLADLERQLSSWKKINGLTTTILLQKGTLKWLLTKKWTSTQTESR